MIISDTDPNGISTVKLFEKIGSTAMINLSKVCRKAGFDQKERGERAETGTIPFPLQI